MAEVLATELAHMQFVCAYWLLYLVPHTQKWPASVERSVSRVRVTVSVITFRMVGTLWLVPSSSQSEKERQQAGICEACLLEELVPKVSCIGY